MRLSTACLLPAALLVTLFATQVGCGDPVATSPPPLGVSYAGCAEALPGPVCLLGDGAEIRLWARSSPAARLEVEGEVEVARAVDAHAGTRFRLRPTSARGALEVVARENGASSTWRLRWQPRPAKPETLRRAEARFADGDPEGARQVLEDASESLSGGDLGAAHRLRGRVERALGDTVAAAEWLHLAAGEFRGAGWSRREASCAAELAYGLIYDADRFGDARAVLDGVNLGPDPAAEARYDLAYLRGLLAVNTGDVRGSLNALGEAAEIAARLGWGVLRMTAEQPLAHQLQRIGRGEEAAAIFSRHRQEMPDDLPDCDRGLLLNNLGWNQLLVREIDPEADSEDPTPWLEEASELFAGIPCPESDERANVAINLALAALQHERPEVARSHLSRAEALEPHPDRRSRFWRLEIAARLAMAEDLPAEALERFRRLEELAAESLDTPTLWKAAAGRAGALEALGRPGDALRAYAEAEEHLDRASLAIPIDGGRESFVDTGIRVTRRHLDLLVRLDRNRGAYELARRARSRVLRSLHRQSRLSKLTEDEQARWDAAIGAYRARRRVFDALAGGEDWQLPADQLRRRRQARQLESERLQLALDAAFAALDELSPRLDETLPALAPDEVRLLYFPARGGWLGFAEGPGGLLVRRLGAQDLDPESLDPERIDPEGLDPESLGRLLLDPFEDALVGVPTVRIFPFSWLRDVDFHALPLDGGAPLLSSHRVLYGLDLPPAASRGPPTRALVVADPSGDLDAARAEGRMVANELRRRAPSLEVEQLEAEDAASQALRDLLPQVDLFHYAGHGVFAGRGGWQSALPLAGESLLTVADILALERAPGLVVLSGCETARSAAAGLQVESPTGLAHAFLVAGSRSVVAAMRPVEDRLAAELVREYYRRWLDGEPPIEALRQAQLALRARDPGSDWASFRLLEP